MSAKPWTNFQVTRNRVPIQLCPLTGGVQTGIGYSLLFDEFEACVAAGLDLERWLAGDYQTRLKNYVVAWFRLRRLIEAHSNEAQIKEMNRKSKGNRRG